MEEEGGRNERRKEKRVVASYINGMQKAILTLGR